MTRILQSDLINRLENLLHVEHCDGCEQNSCDISVAYRLGYTAWAIELFAGSGASSSTFDRYYSQLGTGFRRSAEADRKKLCDEPHIECLSCNSVIWLPDECDGHCGNCGFHNEKIS